MQNRIDRFKRALDYLVPVLSIVMITLVIRLSDLDLSIQGRFYSPGEGWFLKDVQPWDFIYHFGNMPALLLSVSALIFLGLSFQLTRYLKYRLISLYIILVMLIGPGLITNTLLKGQWGRPRPRSITEFGGKYNFEEVMTIDRESKGKSFPCGHCSMGFFFFVLFFILRRKRKLLSTVFLVFALLWGSLIGLARILQGGHFPSDVVWSAFITYITSLLLFDLLKLRQRLFLPVTESTLARFRASRLLRSGIGAAVVLLILIVLIATPYTKEKKYRFAEYNEREYNLIRGDLSFQSADIEIFLADSSGFDLDIYGFGFPKSRISSDFEYDLQDSVLTVVYSQNIRGVFSELSQHVRFYLFDEKKIDLKISTSEGNVFFSDSDRIGELLNRGLWSIDPVEENLSEDGEQIRIMIRDNISGRMELVTEKGSIRF